MKFKQLLITFCLLLLFPMAGLCENSVIVEDDLCDCPEVQASTIMEIPNPDLQLSHLTSITSEGAYSRIFSGITIADVNHFWGDIIWLRDNTEIRKIDLFINSPGGDAFSGLALADIIVQAQEQYNFVIHAHASGVIASAALPIFAVCEIRSAQPGTIFMVHEAALWKWPGRETASDIRAQNSLMELLQERYVGYLVRNSNLTAEQWKIKEKETTWFCYEDALKWGLLDR